MAGVEKLIEKMERQPNNIKFSETEKVLKAYGYELTRIKGVIIFLIIPAQVTGGVCLIKNR